jgi:antitoxin CptB
MIRCLSQRLYSSSRFSMQAPISSAEITGVKKEMLWRARQRGLLELDVIVGSFADKHLPTLSDKETEDFGVVLSLESPDLYKLLSGQVLIPEELKSNEALLKLLKHVNTNHPSLTQ